MTISVTLSIGYLTIPFIIKHSIKSLETTSAEEEDEILTSCPQWTFGNTICISSFVQSPPNIYPTIEKHVLQLASHANTVERETLSILSKSFQTQTNSKRSHGLAFLSKDLLAILSCTAQTNTFTLQIVQYNSNTTQISSQKSYQVESNDNFLDLDMTAKPYEIMELCRVWPGSKPTLEKLAKQVYQTASLYGYWDYWRVFEGICEGHQINPGQLL
ncbi:hypothetical protein MFLAVUS_000754 [Mucor flavus]|uniref:Uncharacterized protein n=1 Tax=Mucor flavus TaxID=439312 RepID=A0ABP9YKL5_9FUNG